MAFGSTPVGVGPGKPTTDSGGKREEFTSAVVVRVSGHHRVRFGQDVLPEGGKTSEVGEPAFDEAWMVVGAASTNATNASTAAVCAANGKCISECCFGRAKLWQAFAQRRGTIYTCI